MVTGLEGVRAGGLIVGGNLVPHRQLLWHTARKAARELNFDYWITQIPVVNRFGRSFDDSRYWKDYQRNTGYSPRYKYRAYGGSGSYAVSETIKYSNKALRKIYG